MNYNNIKKQSPFIFYILVGGKKLGNFYLKTLKEINKAFL